MARVRDTVEEQPAEPESLAPEYEPGEADGGDHRPGAATAGRVRSGSGVLRTLLHARHVAVAVEVVDAAEEAEHARRREHADGAHDTRGPTTGEREDDGAHQRQSCRTEEEFRTSREH